MKILCTTSSFNAAIPSDFDVVKNPYGRRLTEKEAMQLLSEHHPEGLIAGVEPLTQPVLESDPQLKVISRCGVGLDNVDLEAAKRLGVAVYNTPDAPVTSVAELTVGLILSLLRKITIADAAVRRGDWVRLKGSLIQNKTVGIIGCGRIGSAAAELLSVFGCTLIGCDPVLQKHSLLELKTFDTLMSSSDIISLHAPLTKNTRHLINSAALKKMQPHAVLINTARGALIDEDALAGALQNEAIAGAALDVFEEEPYSGPLAALPEKTVLTCHTASSAQESRTVMEEEAVNNLVQALQDGKK